jgi:hypothetical protein
MSLTKGACNMQKQTTQALKQAFIKQAHAQQPIITLAIFVKELDDDVEMSAWILEQYGHDYDEATQMHMRNMLDAQIKMNAGTSVILEQILAHVANNATDNVETQAQEATNALLSKMRLH